MVGCPDPITLSTAGLRRGVIAEPAEFPADFGTAHLWEGDLRSKVVVGSGDPPTAWRSGQGGRPDQNDDLAVFRVSGGYQKRSTARSAVDSWSCFFSFYLAAAADAEERQRHSQQHKTAGFGHSR